MCDWLSVPCLLWTAVVVPDWRGSSDGRKLWYLKGLQKMIAIAAYQTLNSRTPLSEWRPDRTHGASSNIAADARLGVESAWWNSWSVAAELLTPLKKRDWQAATTVTKTNTLLRRDSGWQIITHSCVRTKEAASFIFRATPVVLSTCKLPERHVPAQVSSGLTLVWCVPKIHHQRIERTSYCDRDSWLR